MVFVFWVGGNVREGTWTLHPTSKSWPELEPACGREGRGGESWVGRLG